MATTTEQLIACLVSFRAASRGEVARALGVSAATAYRLLQRAEAEGRVTHFGRGRATRYVLRAPLFQRVVGELPLYHVDASGHVHHLATLTGLADGGVLVRPPGSGAALSRLLLGAAGTGHFDDLPFFLQDLR